MSTFTSTIVTLITASGEADEAPIAGAYFGVPVELLTVEYWIAKTTITFDWIVNGSISGNRIMWCIEDSPLYIKKQVVENNIAYVTKFTENVDARVTKYKTYPDVYKLDSIKYTPTLYDFYEGAINGDASDLVNIGRYSIDVSQFIYNAADTFYKANGRLPLVLFDDYQGKPILIENPVIGRPSVPLTTAVAYFPVQPSYRFDSDEYGVKCPMWAFLGCVQVAGIVKLTDAGPRFVSEDTYFQFQFNMWLIVANFTGLYQPSVSHRPPFQLTRIPWIPAPTEAGRTTRIYAGYLYSVPARWMGVDLGRMYSPAYWFRHVGYNATVNALGYNYVGADWTPFGPQIGLNLFHPELVAINNQKSPRDRERGVFNVWTFSVADRRYLTNSIPLLKTVADAVAPVYASKLGEENARYNQMLSNLSKESTMGLVTFVISAVTMSSLLANTSSLFAGNFSITNLTSALTLADRGELIDTSTFLPILKFANTVYSLGDAALDKISNLSQTALDTTPDILEDATMWDDFDMFGDGGAGTGYEVDFDWFTDMFGEFDFASVLPDNWDMSGFNDWMGLPDDLADVAPGLTAIQVAAVNGASPEVAAQVAAIAAVAEKSTDYWGTFQNLLRNTTSAVMTVGGLVMQYKQAELAFERLKGPTATPQFTTRPTQSGQTVRQPDGSISTMNPDGTITTVRPNGQVVTTGSNSQMPNFASFFTPKNLAIGGGIAAVGVLGYFAMRNSGNRRRR